MSSGVRKVTPIWPQARGVAAELSEKDWEVLNEYCIMDVYDEALRKLRENYCGEDGVAREIFHRYNRDSVIAMALEREFLSTVYKLRNCGILGRE